MGPGQVDALPRHVGPQQVAERLVLVQDVAIRAGRGHEVGRGLQDRRQPRLGLLRLLARVDVHQGAEQAADAPRLVPPPLPDGVRPAEAAVRLPDADVVLVGQPVLHRPLGDGLLHRQVVGVVVRHQRLGGRLAGVGVRAEQAKQLVGQGETARVQVELPAADAGDALRLRQPRLAPPHRLVHPLLRRDVAPDAGDADQHARLVLDGGEGEQHVHQRPVLAPPHHLHGRHVLAAPQPPDRVGDRTPLARPGQHGAVVADDLGGGVAVDALGGGVPTDEGAVQSHGGDGVE